MANQIEVPKAVQYVVTGSGGTEISAPKVIMYLILEPGDIVAGDTSSQGHCYGQIIRRS